MERPKGKKEKGLPGDSLYIYCNYPRVCPVHGTRLVRQLQSADRILTTCNKSVLRRLSQPPDLLQQDLFKIRVCRVRIQKRRIIRAAR